MWSREKPHRHTRSDDKLPCDLYECIVINFLSLEFWVWFILQAKAHVELIKKKKIGERKMQRTAKESTKWSIKKMNRLRQKQSIVNRNEIRSIVLRHSTCLLGAREWMTECVVNFLHWNNWIRWRIIRNHNRWNYKVDLKQQIRKNLSKIEQWSSHLMMPKTIRKQNWTSCTQIWTDRKLPIKRLDLIWFTVSRVRWQKFLR